jgi:hypothetical protein
MPAPISFPDFLSSLADLGRVVREDPQLQERIRSLVAELAAAGDPTPESLATFLRTHPDAVPILVTVAGLTP